MDLFSLLAKLTLDTKEYYKSIDEAEKAARNFEIDTPDLDMTKYGFDATVAEAEAETIEAPESPDLDMTKEGFDETVGKAEDEDVDAPDSPDLDLTKEGFEDTIIEAENEHVDDPESPDLGLIKDDFDDTVAEAENEQVDDPASPHLDLDKQDFDDKIAEAQDQSEGFGGTVKAIFDEIKGALIATGIVGAITGIVNSLKEAINLTAQTADSIDKGSARLNISKKKYQEWDHALRQSGASINDLQKGVIQFNNYLASQEPGKEIAEVTEEGAEAADDMSKAFERLKINIKNDNGELKTTEQLLEESLVALAGFKGTSEERGQLVTQLFGRGGTSLNALLDSGVEGVQELLEEANKLGLIMSDEEITNAVAYGDAVANLQEELQQIRIAFVEDIIPVLTSAVQWLTDFLTKLNPRLQTSSIYQTFKDIDKKTMAASKQVDSATVAAKKLIEDLKEMGDYWSLDEQGRMTWDALAERAIELFPELSNYIDRDGKKIRGNTTDIENNIEAWARLEKQRLLASAMDDKREAVAKQLTTAYEKGAEASLKENEAYAQRIEAIQKLNDLLKENGRATVDVTATDEELSKALTDFMESLPDDDPLQLQAGLIFKQWGETLTEAAKLRTEANKLITEAEGAQEKLDEYEQALAKQMGLTQAEVIKATDEVTALEKELNNLPTDVYTTIHVSTDDAEPKAIGDAYIPYDNFPALLHRGERVLTATEARNYNNGADLSGLEDRIIYAIREGMRDVEVTAYMDGAKVTRDVSERIARENGARRFG